MKVFLENNNKETLITLNVGHNENTETPFHSIIRSENLFFQLKYFYVENNEYVFVYSQVEVASLDIEKGTLE